MNSPNRHTNTVLGPENYCKSPFTEEIYCEESVQSGHSSELEFDTCVTPLQTHPWSAENYVFSSTVSPNKSGDNNLIEKTINTKSSHSHTPPTPSFSYSASPGVTNGTHLMTAPEDTQIELPKDQTIWSETFTPVTDSTLTKLSGTDKLLAQTSLEENIFSNDICVNEPDNGCQFSDSGSSSRYILFENNNIPTKKTSPMILQSTPATCPSKDSSTSEELSGSKEENFYIPDCEAKKFLFSIGRLLQRSDEEIIPVVYKIVCENWLETIAHLQSLSEADWCHLALPRHFLRCLLMNLPNAKCILSGLVRPHSNGIKQLHSSHRSTAANIAAVLSTEHLRQGSTNANGHSTVKYENNRASLDHAAASNEVVQFAWRVCSTHRCSAAETESAIKCLYEENWFDSLAQLRALTSHQWGLLGLTEEISSLLQHTLESDPDDEDIVERIIVKAGSAMGRPAQQLKLTVERLKQHGITSAESLRNISDDEWTGMRLPLRLLEEVRKEVEQVTEDAIHRANNPLISFTDPSRQSFLSETGNASESFTCGNRQLNTQHSEARAKGIISSSSKESLPTIDERIVSTKEDRDKKMITVKALLLKAGTNVGKSETDMLPIIDRVVHENWVDSIRVLRSLPTSDWQSLGIPKRIVEELNKLLSDPYALELNTVQFSSPEPELFPSDVISAVWRLESEIPPDKLPDTLRSLLKLMETILCNPFDESKRLIRKSNPNFQKRAGQFKSGILILESVGYEEFGDTYLLFTAFISRITEAHAALAQLAQLHRDRIHRTKQKPIRSTFFSSIRQ